MILKNYNMKIVFITLYLFTVFAFSCNEKKEKACCKNVKTLNGSINENITSESIFNLESKWVKQNKDSLYLSDLSNKITVAAMVFTHCESACPRIVADMQRIEKEFTEEELQKIHFLLISMDPIRDTPDRFVEFTKEHQLNDNWICISSNDVATMELANVLNVKIKPLSDGGFDHSNTIHLIDRNGIIAFQQIGLSQEPTEIIKNIKILIK